MFLILVVVLALVVLGSGGLYWALHNSQGGSSRTVYFQVGPGDGVTSIADRLSGDGLISNTLFFRLDARIQGLGGKLKVGDYALRHNMSIDQVVSTLADYRVATARVTIPEGRRIEENAAILQAAGVDARSYLAEASHPAARGLRIGVLADKPASATLEGYLFPDTYEVTPHSSGRQFAIRQVRHLDQLVTPAMRQALRRQHRTIFQALILASIVEREARLDSERGTIAGVFVNRLNTGMVLDADPTVQYAAGHSGNWWPVLYDLAKNIDPASPYNTYDHQGLPPGPIANPGLKSILAAVYPKNTPYFYFVAVRGGHGKHVFAKTLQEQTANQAKYG
jgi:UPF0755 protein